MKIIRLTDHESGDPVYVNMEAIIAMRPYEDGAALFLKDAQRLNVRESAPTIAAMEFASALDKEAIVNAIDDARRSLDVWSANRGVADATWFGRIGDMMSKLGRIENAVLS